MHFEFIETNINDVWLIETNGDHVSKELINHYCNPIFKTQFNIEEQRKYQKGELRELYDVSDNHILYQTVEGEVYYVVTDHRKESQTKGKIFRVLLSKKNRWSLYIPPDVHVGFLILSNSTLVDCKKRNNGQLVNKINWSDPDFNMYWPLKEYKISRPKLIM